MTIEYKQIPGTPKGPVAAKQERPSPALKLAAIGLEAEFSLFIDDQEKRPEDVFGNPRAFVQGPLMHRTGTSYHLPTGGAVYFDTGVIEVATPVIEIEAHCAARAGRSLWESLHVLRQSLDAWERRTGHEARLVGFSTHYNISFEMPNAEQGTSRTVEKLALLLAYVLPVPVMVLAANRRSTGIGVRPRGDRIEITADFTPSASLMIATATLITGIVRAVMKWPSFELDTLATTGLPILENFRPMPHTSRKGWLARHDCFPQNPFASDLDAPLWPVQPSYYALNHAPHTLLSLREIAATTTRYFRRAIRRLADPFTVRLINGVLMGRAPSLLDLPDRPDAYEDVGRLCLWDDLFPERRLARSRYERVLIRAIAGQRLHIRQHTFTPVGMKGWAEVIFRRHADDTRHVFSIDYLVDHLDAWERG